MSKREEWIKKLEEVNGNRRARTLTLEDIENQVKQAVADFKGFKKNIRYLSITNVVCVANSYKFNAFYTGYEAKLNYKGEIKELIIDEFKCPTAPYGGSETLTFIPRENLEIITKLDLKSTDLKVIHYLEGGVLNGDI